MDVIKNFFTGYDWQAMGIDWGTRLVLSVVIFVVGRWVAKTVTEFLRRTMLRYDIDDTLENFICNLVYAILITAVVIAALDSLGLPVTSLMAVMGAAGLAIGLALKDSLGNFASGIMLVMFRPFTKGDFVEVAGVSGKVEEVRIFNTVLITGDNRCIIIPNGQVASDTITNYSTMDQRRVDLVIGVGYDDDLKVARSVLERICKEHPLVLDDPETGIALTNLGDSSVDFAVRPWTKTGDYWTVRADLLEAAKVELESAGCSIPYPQTDVHVHQS